MEITLGPWFWGMAGAFIFAAPKWSACYFESRSSGGPWWRCTVDLGTALATGAICGEAFGPSLVQLLNVKGTYANAVAALVGLLANPYAPKLIDVLGALATNVLSEKLLKVFKGETTK